MWRRLPRGWHDKYLSELNAVLPNPGGWDLQPKLVPKRLAGLQGLNVRPLINRHTDVSSETIEFGSEARILWGATWQNGTPTRACQPLCVCV